MTFKQKSIQRQYEVNSKFLNKVRKAHNEVEEAFRELCALDEEHAAAIGSSWADTIEYKPVHMDIHEALIQRKDAVIIARIARTAKVWVMLSEMKEAEEAAKEDEEGASRNLKNVHLHVSH